MQNLSTDPTNESAETATPDQQIHYDRPWANSILRPALIAIMIACIIVAVLAFMRYAVSGIPVPFTSVMIFLGIAGALIGCASTTLLAQPGQRMRRGTGIRSAEILLLLLLVRLTSWATVGNWPTFNQILTRPIDSLFDAPFVVITIIVALGWMMASAMTSDFLKMGLQADELYAARQRTGRSSDDPTPPNYTDRRGVLRSFTNKWLLGALFMVIMAAGTQLAPAESGFFALGRQNIDPAVISAVVIYMLTGLILLSQGQLAVLRARWTLERIPSSATILRNWPIYTTLLILSVGILATLLPFGDTFYLSIIISSIIQYVFLAATFIMQVFLAIFLLIVALFGGEPQEEIPQAVENTAPIVPPQMEMRPEDAGFPPWLGGSIFWLLMALLLGYAVYIYFSGRGSNLNWLRQFWSMLRIRWRELLESYQTWQQNRQADAGSEGKAEKSGRSLLSRLTGRTRWQDLAPDQQVRYFYLNMLDQAEKAGIGRHSGETPLQYAPRLVQTLEEKSIQSQLLTREEIKNNRVEGDKIERNALEKEESSPVVELNSQEVSDAFADGADRAIHTLTKAFVRTRYAQVSVKKAESGALKNAWELLTKRLRS